MEIDLTGATAFNIEGEKKEFALLPKDRYLVQIDEAEVREKSAGNFLSLRFEVKEGKFANRKIFMEYPVSLNNHDEDWIMKSKSIMKTILEIGGKSIPEGAKANDKLFIGITLEAKVVQKDPDGDYPKNIITYYGKPPMTDVKAELKKALADSDMDDKIQF
tara:strand:- start:464 stop:946 length:483 start_codon:yes stop_codon:yes gene_type:complete